MSRSRVPVALTALTALFTAAVGADQDVVLGQLPEGDDARQRVYVGWSGDEGDDLVAPFAQEYRGAGHRVKDETFAVRCAVVCWWGDDDAGAPAALVEQAFDVFGMVEDAVRALTPGAPGTTPLGLTLPTKVTISEGELRADPGWQRVRIPFTVRVETRI